MRSLADEDKGEFNACVYVGENREMQELFSSYELASIACLEKAAEIIEQNK
jgi:hypothetical protein